MAVMGEDQDIRRVDDLDVVVLSQKIVQKVVILLMHAKCISKIQPENTFVFISHLCF
jgi:hypothetical protein